jgi:hypothetical protein
MTLPSAIARDAVPLTVPDELKTKARDVAPEMRKCHHIRIAHKELLDYLNGCKRLRTRWDKVELLVELSCNNRSCEL